jgi:competence protein CoiA
MKFALVNGIKQESSPQLKGVCCNCGTTVIAKCGTRKIWHWSHTTLQHCDSWWENETEWHRLWKGYFPSQNQEIINFDNKTGEKHIADIKTNNGMVIEIQNSPMNELEMLSREHFYGKMMWIINGAKFKNNFTILGKLPDPKSEIGQAVFFDQPTSAHWYVKQLKTEPTNNREKLINDHVRFILKSENPEYEKMLKSGDKTRILKTSVTIPTREDINRVLKEIQSNYVGHHLFIWRNPRDIWFQAEKPVFIDFGGDELWRLIEYDLRGLMCVRKISKTALVEKNGGCIASNTNNAIISDGELG